MGTRLHHSAGPEWPSDSKPDVASSQVQKGTSIMVKINATGIATMAVTSLAIAPRNLLLNVNAGHPLFHIESSIQATLTSVYWNVYVEVCRWFPSDVGVWDPPQPPIICWLRDRYRYFFQKTLAKFQVHVFNTSCPSHHPFWLFFIAIIPVFSVFFNNWSSLSISPSTGT